MAPGITPLAVLVDARSGQLLQSAVGEVPDIDSVPPEEADSVFTLISRPDAAALVIGKKVDLPGEAGRMRIRAEAVCQYPTLVWKPCRESLSPLVPFYMFTVGAHSIYVRIDGAIFMSLDDSGRGF
jgi:hypothetical protein